ncbi:MAG: ABC transporter ATP-binding protein, partial [Chloroflexaceae bacterium]|nr:ABC transporter ATP-binding protein [Chloroflexaceae bacterium]
MPETPAIEVQNLSKSYSTPAGLLPVLRQVNLRVPTGAFTSIIGPSGSGKSTLFNIIAGLEQPDAGTVLLAGQPATGQRGQVAYMPQRDALLPWRTVLDNAVLATTVQRGDVAVARREARALLPTFGLEGFGESLPAALSGGMRQRAALLRTVMWKQPMMLLDEPFGALDAITRAQLQRWLLTLWDELDRTVLLVTHDVDEAILLSDYVAVLTARPARVALTLTMDLPRPRTYQMITTPAFAHLKEQLLAA